MRDTFVATLFLSTFINKVDKKGRVSVPAPFRMAVSHETFPGVVLFRSYKNKALEGCGLSWMTRLSHSLDTMDLFSDAQDNLAATIFADAHQMAFDGDGRISLPDVLLRHGLFKEKIAFVGRGSTFQIWDPETFSTHQQQARENALKNKMFLKLPQQKD